MHNKILVIVILLAGLGYYVSQRRAIHPEPMPESISETTMPPIPSTAVDAKPQLALTASPPPGQNQQQVQVALNKLQNLYAQAKYKETLDLALSLSRDAKYPENFRAWIKQQLPAIRTSLGWLQVQEGRCDTALAFFEEAFRQTPLREAQKGLAICHYRLKNYDSAEEYMTRYLESNGSDGPLKVLYADILESSGRFEDALTVLNSIQDAHMDEKTRSAMMVEDRRRSMQAKVKESGHQVTARSQYFTVSYRADEHQSLGPWALDVLEAALSEFIRNLGFTPPEAPIETVLYPDQGFRELVSYSPKWSNGLFDGRLRIPIKEHFNPATDAAEVQRVLRHELVHALLSDRVGRRGIPAWFGEGLAQLVECPGACRFDQFPPDQSSFLSSSALEGDFTRLNAQDAKHAYLQSHYLIQTLNSPSAGLPPQALRIIIENLSPQQTLDSQSLLQPLDMQFQDLIERAAKYWQKKQNLPF